MFGGPSGSILAAPLSNRKLGVWALQGSTIKQQCLLSGHSARVKCLALAANVPLLASGGMSQINQC